MGRVDLHIHTEISDGQYSVKDMIKMIIEYGITFFSFTDHDTIKQCQEMKQIKLPENINYIDGIELSAHIDGIKCHILGYNIDYENENLQELCRNIKLRKLKKIKDIITNIQLKHNIEIPDNMLNELLQKDKPIGRTDLCDLLIQLNYGTKKEIFEKYLCDDVGNSNSRIEAETIIESIKKAGGQAILAHPKEIEEDYKNINIEQIMLKLMNIGLDGIEVYNSIHSLNDAKRYLLFAQKNNLLWTGGSDYHGDQKPNILGTTTVEKIKIKRSKIRI